MILSALSFLVVEQSSSEFPDGLMNNPVLHELPKGSLTRQAMYYNVTWRRVSVTIVEAEK